jgi:hypothetical protein
MKRPQLNFLVDTAAFVLFLLLMSSGLLLRYQLPPGSGELEGHSPGRGSADRVLTQLWGQTRHEWGDVHFWISAALIGVLALHLFLHWNWIVGIMRGKPSEASGWRFGIGAASFVAIIFLSLTPMFTPTQQATRQQLLADENGTGAPDLPLDELRGSLTLEEAAELGGIPVVELRNQLDLPQDTSPQARLGRTLRDNGKTMSDFRRLIAAPTNRNHSGDQLETEP